LVRLCQWKQVKPQIGGGGGEKGRIQLLNRNAVGFRKGPWSESPEGGIKREKALVTLRGGKKKAAVTAQGKKILRIRRVTEGDNWGKRTEGGKGEATSQGVSALEWGGGKVIRYIHQMTRE